MRRLFILLLALLGFNYVSACTDFLVGKAASADGSTILSYAADNYGGFGELFHFSAATHPEGSLRNIFEWGTGRYLGQIKEAPCTYNVIGYINEYQLSIGESTFGGRPELTDSLGILDY